MAPPFILERLKHNNAGPRKTCIIHAKNEYSNNIKTAGWQYRFTPDSPVEKKPQQSECICDRYKTTYKRMNEQLDLKNNYIDPDANKHLFNYFGYSDDKISDENWHDRARFPTIMRNDHNMALEYLTTMQTSYSSPTGLVMQKLRAPEERFMAHRRMKGCGDDRIQSKFLDDRVAEINRQIQCERQGRRGISFNFMTGYNTDGSLPKELSMIDHYVLMKKLNKR